MQRVGTWTTTPASVEGVALGDQTLRMIAHVSIGGQRVRVRVSNAYGTRRSAIGAPNRVSARHTRRALSSDDRIHTSVERKRHKGPFSRNTPREGAAADAHRHMAARRHFGKVVLRVTH